MSETYKTQQCYKFVTVMFGKVPHCTWVKKCLSSSIGIVSEEQFAKLNKKNYFYILKLKILLFSLYILFWY
ncbi:hypothetical protein QTP88_012714 [Uroleucon formosanum]